MIKNTCITIFVLLILLFGGFGIYNYHISHAKIEKLNICQNDDVVSKLIEQNVNPFSRFKFVKQRSADCKELLIENREKALKLFDKKYCPILEASKSSTIMLIHIYVNELYDRRAASQELDSLIPLMNPYNYCPEYIDNMIDLIKIKRRMAL